MIISKSGIDLPYGLHSMFASIIEAYWNCWLVAYREGSGKPLPENKEKLILRFDEWMLATFGVPGYDFPEED